MQCVSISVYLSFSEKDEIKCYKTNIDLNEVVMHQSIENYGYPFVKNAQYYDLFPHTV